MCQAPPDERLWQGHQFHPDSQEKQDWILELSCGNAVLSSQANLYKPMPRLAFKSMSFWMRHGVQKVGSPETFFIVLTTNFKVNMERSSCRECEERLTQLYSIQCENSVRNIIIDRHNVSTATCSAIRRWCNTWKEAPMHRISFKTSCAA